MKELLIYMKLHRRLSWGANNYEKNYSEQDYETERIFEKRSGSIWNTIE